MIKRPKGQKPFYFSVPPPNPGDEPHHHNHRLKQDRLVAEGKIPLKPGLLHIGVAHDDWCAIFKGGFCNCDPDILVGGKKIE
jgi:hypothetical protein